LQLLYSVRRETYNRIGADDGANGPWRQIVLADVHSCGARESCDVGSIVDDDDRAGRPRQLDDRRSCVEEDSARQLLGAQLKKPYTGVEKCAGELEGRRSDACRGIDVDDGAECIDTARPPRRGGRC